MKLTILKPFPYAADHINAVMVEPGEAEIADDVATGLIVEGYARDPAKPQPIPMQQVPVDKPAAPAAEKRKA
ncbi:hypothetical protein [Rhodoplanes elegans]|uniref:hypothetical protein n=1 Tax=Rhodoplanes elegans TaxID=29408 RepID=UPI000DAC1D02|nr:hypothetical protein [Rhodoplanes elegans]